MAVPCLESVHSHLLPLAFTAVLGTDPAIAHGKRKLPRFFKAQISALYWCRHLITHVSLFLSFEQQKQQQQQQLLTTLFEDSSDAKCFSKSS